MQDNGHHIEEKKMISNTSLSLKEQPPLMPMVFSPLVQWQWNINHSFGS